MGNDNFEKIKAMSVEEMADFLKDPCCCEYCHAEGVCTSDIQSCRKGLEKWLESEVKEK